MFTNTAGKTEVMNKKTKLISQYKGHVCTEKEQKHSSILSLTSALDLGGRLTIRPSLCAHGKESRYPLHRRLGGPQGRF